MNEVSAFVDANIFLRYLIDDNPVQSPIAASTFLALETGDIRAETSQTVIFEAVHVLASIYKVPRDIVADRMARVIQFEGLHIAERTALVEAFSLWKTFARLSFPDAFHLLLTAKTRHKTILSFDRGLDRCLPVVTRIETLP